MAFRGITFSGQNVTPKNDGALYNAHYGDGILEGCSMAISGDDLVIQSGHIIACGRACQVDGATNVDLSGRTLQTGYIQVILNYDISQGEGQQWFSTFVESATTTFPALTQEDINTPTGTLYQLQLAVVQISGGNLTAITSSLQKSFVVADSTDTTENGMYITNNGNKVGKICGTDQAFYGGLTNPDGTLLAGFTAGGNALSVFADGGNISVLPNGWASAVGATIFAPDGTIICSGQVINGITVQGAATAAASLAVVAGTPREVIHYPLAHGGKYICIGNVGFNQTVTGSGYAQLIGNYVVSQFGQNRAYTYLNGNTGEKRMHLVWYCEGNSASYPNAYLNILSPYAGTVVGYDFRVIRIG